MASYYAASRQDHRILRLEDHTCRILHGIQLRIFLRCGLFVKWLFAFRNRHFRYIHWQINVGCSRLFTLCVFERQTYYLAHGIRAYHHLGTLGDRFKHLCQIQELMSGNVHALRSHLSGNSH